MRWSEPIPASLPVTGPNERCIEIPLALEIMALDKPGRVFDAGCALNGHLHDDLTATVYHLTQNIASETAYAHTARPLSYISGDLRDLSLFADGAFDRTVCVSTLEHVGLDNTTYRGPREHCPQTMFRAVKELCRVTRTALLLTVPFSEPGMSCAQWRFLDTHTVGHMAKLAFNFGYRVDVRFYATTEGGWYGGSLDPVPANPTGFPHRVNAIVCLRCERDRKDHL